MSKLPLVARILLGLIFFVFGLNGFLQFLPMPPLPEGPAGQMIGAFMASGYMFPLIKGTEVICGLLLLAGRFVPLALVILAPVVINIFCFHIVLVPDGMPMAVVLVVLEAYLGWSYRCCFKPILSAQCKCS